MTIETTTDFEKAAIARIRSYQDAAGRSVGVICSNRVHISQAPDGAAFPYVVVRIRTTPDPEYAGAREEWELEAEVYARPRAKEQEAVLVAELAAKALLTWRVSSAADGLIFGQSAERSNDPPLDAPEDREVCFRKVIARGVSWPPYLTSAVP